MARESRICDKDMRKILFFFSRKPTFWAATPRVVNLSLLE